MSSEIKRSQLTECISHSVAMYLSRNADILGSTSILGVFLSDDMREVKILIKFLGTEGNSIELLNSRKKDISAFCNKNFSTKYLPRMKFIKAD